MKKILLVMAAGLGSRYGGVKQMAGVGPNNEILMEYSIYDALKAGFEKIVVIIKQEMLQECAERFGGKVTAKTGIEINYAVQSFSYKGINFPENRTKPMGTVHAVLSAVDFLREGTFLAINADDYYGRDAFIKAAKHMDNMTNPIDSAMVAYKLKNTVSRFGSVTRGICTVNDDYLGGVTETYEITVGKNSVITDSTGNALNGESPVSMNMWAYHTASLKLIADYFETFLERLSADDNKSECLLPVMMDDFIRAGKMKTKLVTTDGVWFGLTYREDREGVMSELNRLYEKGVYPQKLWE